MKKKYERVKLHLANGKTMIGYYEGDEYLEIYEHWVFKKNSMHFINFVIRSEEVIAIEYMER